MVRQHLAAQLTATPARVQVQVGPKLATRGIFSGMTSADAIIKLRQLIDDQRVVMLSSIAPSGEIHGRPITLCEVADDGRLWFLVSNEADWVAGMAAGSAVNVGVANNDEQTWVSIAGPASVHHDKARVDRLWSPAASIFFPGGKDDPNLRLLAVEPQTAEYWDAPSGRLQQLALMALGKISSDRPDLGDSGTIDMS